MTKDAFPKIYLYRRIVLAKLFIDDHFNEDINLSDLADEALFSKFHFYQFVSRIIGCLLSIKRSPGLSHEYGNTETTMLRSSRAKMRKMIK